jgi:hypothetical protein
MNRFWDRYTGPIIREVAPSRIVEIGADLAWNTRHLLAYCRQNGAFIDVVDTVPSPDLMRTLAEYGPGEYALHVAKSVDAIPRLTPADIVMLDGDHNYRTVYAELSAFWLTAHSQGRVMPIILAHDCAWPYARRDMYYNPDDFTDGERHPYAYQGMLPGVRELVEDGMNGTLANALVEGGPQNGVLTAIEDFVAAHDDIRLWTLPFFNGLGMIIPELRLTDGLRALIESFYTPDALITACQEIEAYGMRSRAEMLTERKKLQRRTEALTRARALLQQKDERIAALEAELAAARIVPASGTDTSRLRRLLRG